MNMIYKNIYYQEYMIHQENKMEALIIKAFIAMIAPYCAMYAGLALYFKYRNKE